MKKLILVLLASLLLTGCASLFVPKKANYDENVYAAQLVEPHGYQLIHGSVEFFGSTFHRVNIFTGKAYFGGRIGYIMVNKDMEPVRIIWSETGEFNIVDTPPLML